MKKNLLIILIISLLVSCKNDKNKDKASTLDAPLLSNTTFGKAFVPNDAITMNFLSTKYSELQVGDSIETKIMGKVNEVCKAKGCWMKLKMNEEEVLVKFKDYGFFVPRNLKDEEVVVQGKAYVKEISVEEQRHYAKDAGKNEDELNAITTPKRTFLFEADGVSLNKS